MLTDLKRLDYFLKLIYDPEKGAVTFTPIADDLPSSIDIGSVASLDEVLTAIFDPDSVGLRIKLSGGDALSLKSEKILTIVATTDYPISNFPRGDVMVAVKGGGRLDPDDVGGWTVIDVAGVPTLSFGTAPPAGKILFIDYIK